MIEKQAYTYKKFVKNGWQIFLLFVLFLAFSMQTALQEPLLAAGQSNSLVDSSAWPKLTFTDVSITPEPIVGQIATLNIEVTSTVDEAKASLAIQLPPDVDLVKGDLVWSGSLRANQPQVHQVAIVVQKKPTACEADSLHASPSGAYLIQQYKYNCHDNLIAQLIPTTATSATPTSTSRSYFLDWSPDGN